MRAFAIIGIVVALSALLGCGVEPTPETLPFHAEKTDYTQKGDPLTQGTWSSSRTEDESLVVTADGATLNYPCYEAAPDSPDGHFTHVCDTSIVSEPILIKDGRNIGAEAV